MKHIAVGCGVVCEPINVKDRGVAGGRETDAARFGVVAQMRGAARAHEITCTSELRVAAGKMRAIPRGGCRAVDGRQDAGQGTDETQQARNRTIHWKLRKSALQGRWQARVQTLGPTPPMPRSAHITQNTVSAPEKKLL